LPNWIPKPVILAMHDELLREHGGLDGTINEGALESTLARPQNLVAYKNPAPPTIFDLAASYGFGFARNHCFADGNKRVALVSIDVFLQLNGFELVVEEMEAVELIKLLAAGEINEEQLSKWIQRNSREFKI
jgi:death-on-curing protein